MQGWPNASGLFIQSAENAPLTCVDRLSDDDFLGDTSAMFGHSPRAVAQILGEQVNQGLTCMLPVQCAAEVGVRLTALFGLLMWQMALSLIGFFWAVLNLNPADGRLLGLSTLDESNTCAHDALHLMGQALQVCRFRPLALLLAPSGQAVRGHSRLARDLLRQSLGRAQLPDLG